LPLVGFLEIRWTAETSDPASKPHIHYNVACCLSHTEAWINNPPEPAVERKVLASPATVEIFYENLVGRWHPLVKKSNETGEGMTGMLLDGGLVDWLDDELHQMEGPSQ
jgi:hypothetical protein